MLQACSAASSLPRDPALQLLQLGFTLAWNPTVCCFDGSESYSRQSMPPTSVTSWCKCTAKYSAGSIAQHACGSREGSYSWLISLFSSTLC